MNILVADRRTCCQLIDRMTVGVSTVFCVIQVRWSRSTSDEAISEVRTVCTVTNCPPAGIGPPFTNQDNIAPFGTAAAKLLQPPTLCRRFLVLRLEQLAQPLGQYYPHSERRNRKMDSDASGLSNLLNSQQQEAQANAPDAMSMLSPMLDQNKDGSSMDDLQRIAASFFK